MSAQTAAREVAEEVVGLIDAWGYTADEKREIARELRKAAQYAAVKDARERAAQRAARAERKAEQEFRTHRGAGEPTVCTDCFLAHRGDCF